jgi:hypothetical protein
MKYWITLEHARQDSFHGRHGPTSLRLPLQGMETQPTAQPLNVCSGMLLSCMAGLIACIFVCTYVIGRCLMWLFYSQPCSSLEPSTVSALSPVWITYNDASCCCLIPDTCRLARQLYTCVLSCCPLPCSAWRGYGATAGRA